MLVVALYDISTETEEGKKRLSKAAKICKNYGQRVQNSVYECLIDPTQFLKLENELLRCIKGEEDSLKFYFLGANYTKRIKNHGIKNGFDIEGTLTL